MKRPLIFVFSCLALPLSTLPTWAQNSVSIHITDPTGKSLPNADVAFRIWGETKARNGVLHADATGTAVLSLEKTVDPDKPVGSVVVHAKGFAPEGGPIKSKALEFKVQPGATWNSKIVDSKGQPVAGATVKIGATRKKGAKGAEFLVVSNEAMRADYTTTSGADGTFQISDLPVGGTFGYSVSKAGFADFSTPGQVSFEEAKSLTLQPEAKLHGKVVGVDGQPIVGVRVYARDTDIGFAVGATKTAADGTYTIDALPAGQYLVGVTEPPGANYIVPETSNVMAAAEKTREVPELRAVAGVVVSGVARDKVTGKPLAGVSIGSTNTTKRNVFASSDETKADGKFSLRVLPGMTRFYINQVPDGFVSDEQGQTLDVGSQAMTPLVFSLQKAPLLTGTVIDENNRPIKASLRLGGTWGGETVTSDSQGKWKYQPRTLNDIQVSGGEDENSYYEVVANKQWKVTSSAPIVVKIRKHPWQSLEGRVVSRDGKPLAGVEVSAEYYVNMGNSGALDGTTRIAITDEQGHYKIKQIPAAKELSDVADNPRVRVTQKGLMLVSGGTLSRQGEDWTASDIVLAALNRRIEGQTEAGARVVAGGKETTADDKGHFAFEEMPEGETLVCAVLDGKFGSALVEEATAPLRIELDPMKAQGVDVELGRDAWREVVKEGTDAKFFALDWVSSQLTASNNEGTFESLKRTDDGPTTMNVDWTRAGNIIKWAPKLPVGNRIEKLEDVIGSIYSPEVRLMTWLDVAIKTDDSKVGKRALLEADTTLQKAPPDFNFREFNLYRLAVVTEKVQGTKAGSEALGRAIQWTMAHNAEKPFYENGRQIETSRDEMFKLEADNVAEGSDVMLRQLLDAIDPESGFNIEALQEAIPVIARKRGVEAALVMLDELGKLPKPENKGGDGIRSFDPQWSFDRVARQLIQPLGEKSPQRALELARRINNPEYRARALAIAAKFQSPEEAAKLFREAVEGAEPSETARIAAQAWEQDPKLGAELFDLIHQKLKTMDTRYGRMKSWPSYGFYFAQFDPASARLELEREWDAERLKTDGDTGNLAYFAMAMSAVDGKRALEMARAIPKGKDSFWSLEARTKIPQYLMATPEQRRDFPFNRWSATDTWQPGDPDW